MQWTLLPPSDSRLKSEVCSARLQRHAMLDEGDHSGGPVPPPSHATQTDQ